MDLSYGFEPLNMQILCFIEIRLLIDLFLEFIQMICIRSYQEEFSVFFQDPDDLFFGDRRKDGSHLVGTFVIQRIMKDRIQEINSTFVSFRSDLQTGLAEIDADLILAFEPGSIISLPASQIHQGIVLFQKGIYLVFQELVISL